MIRSEETSFESRIQDNDRIEKALRQGVKEAIRVHRAMGRKIPVWENGAVVWMEADELDSAPEVKTEE